MSAQLSRDDWKGRIGGLNYRNQAFIGGKFAPSLTGKTFDCINPATGQVLTKVAACEQADVDAAVKAARAAFDKGTWANMAPAQRKRIMLKLAELMMKNREELALLETLDMGKPIAFSTTVDIPGSANTVQWFAEAIDKIYDEVAPTPVRKSSWTSTLFFAAHSSTSFFIAALPLGTQWSHRARLNLPAAPAVRICTSGKAVAAAPNLRAVRLVTLFFGRMA
jgi:hypothetical protein